jgi:hypothetical protein
MQIGFNRKAEQKPRPRTPFFSQANNALPPLTAALLSNDCNSWNRPKAVLLLGEMNSNYFTGQFALRFNIMIEQKMTGALPPAKRHTRCNSLPYQIRLGNPKNDEDKYELQKYSIIELRYPPARPGHRWSWGHIATHPPDDHRRRYLSSSLTASALVWMECSFWGLAEIGNLDQESSAALLRTLCLCPL